MAPERVTVVVPDNAFIDSQLTRQPDQYWQEQRLFLFLALLNQFMKASLTPQLEVGLIILKKPSSARV